MKLKFLVIGLSSCMVLMSQIPQTSNLVGEYKFTGNTDDSSGNNYNGQTYGGPTLTQDRFGNNNYAYSLDGTDDYIHFDDNMLSEWNTTDGWIVESFSISFWAKSSASSTEPIIAFGVHDNGLVYGGSSLYKGMITRFGSQISFNSNNWGFNYTTNKTYDGNWHHYVLVWNYDTGYRQIYIDGSFVSQYRQVENNTIRKRFAIKEKALSLGRERYETDGNPDDPGLASTGTYTGSVDEVRIWNLALTSSEISNLYSYDNTSSNYTPETFTNSSGDNQWDTASNWASGIVPTSSTNVTISSSQTIEAGSSAFNSIRLDKSQSNYLSINNSSGTFQETGDFTFEMWVKINEWDCGYACYKAAFLGYSQHNFWLSINGNGKPQFRMGCGDLTFNYSATSNNWLGNWKHMAIVRDGNTLKFFVDGILEATSSCSGGTFMDSSTIKIGKNDGWTHYLDAWISKIRYVKGSALYSSNFTPPTSLSNVAGTHLLLNVDSQANAFVDSSDNNHTVSIHGSTDPYFVSLNGPSGSGNSTTAVANDITIDSGGSLTIAKNSHLTLSGDFTNNGTVTLNSDADEFSSIIVGGSSSGDIVYNRYVNTQGTDEWDLIGSPVDGLSISSFVTTNSSPLATSGSTYAVGVYDNSDSSWTNYTSSTVGAAGNFDIGKGYQMATSSGATMAFTGTIATTDQTQSIVNNAGSGGKRWNLVANPYPSYLKC